MSTDLNEYVLNTLEPNQEQVSEANRLLLEGRTLISNDCYSQDATDLFNKAKELDPDLIGAWVELARCCELKEDIDGAIKCLEEALKRSDPNKPNKTILRNLSAFIRQHVGRVCVNQEEKITALLRSLDLSKQALKSDLCDAESYYNLAKAYMCLFFATECVDQQLIILSRAAFVKALDLSNSYISRHALVEENKTGTYEDLGPKSSVLESRNNHDDPPRPYIEQSDFLYNYSSVLIYLQEFQKALEYLRLAIKWDPDWDEPKLLEKSLIDYLRQIHSMVRDLSKGNKRMLKRFAKIVDSLKDVEKFEQIIQHDQCRLLKSQEIHVKSFTLRELQDNQYTKVAQKLDVQPALDSTKEVKLLHLRLINTVNYNQAMYLTFVAIDQEYSLIIVTIYNLAESKSPLPKDLVTIVEPKIDQVTVGNLTSRNTDCNISFERINVREFRSLYINGRRITIDQVSKPQFKVSLLPQNS